MADISKKRVVAQIQEYLAEELKAGPEEERAKELQSLLLMYRFLPVREYGAEDVACPSALVELEFNQTVAFYYIAPQGGGLITRVDGKPVQVVTPSSPMGEALMGRKAGEEVQVSTQSGKRVYRVKSVT